MTSQDVFAPEGQQEKPRLGVKEAARAARAYFDEIYRDDHLEGVLLEEIFLSDDERVWHVTFGYDTDRPSVVGPTAVGPARARFVREYKTVQIDSSDGAFIAVKIRPV